MYAHTESKAFRTLYYSRWVDGWMDGQREGERKRKVWNKNS